MKTIAACLFFALTLAGTASARELDATPSFESPRVVTSARTHDDRALGMKKDGTVPAKYDTAFPTHDGARSRARGSI